MNFLINPAGIAAMPSRETQVVRPCPLVPGQFTRETKLANSPTIPAPRGLPTVSVRLTVEPSNDGGLCANARTSELSPGQVRAPIGHGLSAVVRPSKTIWSPSEVKVLRTLIEKGEHRSEVSGEGCRTIAINWAAIVKLVPGKTADQVRSKYFKLRKDVLLATNRVVPAGENSPKGCTRGSNKDQTRKDVRAVNERVVPLGGYDPIRSSSVTPDSPNGCTGGRTLGPPQVSIPGDVNPEHLADDSSVDRPEGNSAGAAPGTAPSSVQDSVEKDRNPVCSVDVEMERSAAWNEQEFFNQVAHRAWVRNRCKTIPLPPCPRLYGEFLSASEGFLRKVRREWEVNKLRTDQVAEDFPFQAFSRAVYCCQLGIDAVRKRRKFDKTVEYREWERNTVDAVSNIRRKLAWITNELKLRETGANRSAPRSQRFRWWLVKNGRRSTKDLSTYRENLVQELLCLKAALDTRRGDARRKDARYSYRGGSPRVGKGSKSNEIPLDETVAYWKSIFGRPKPFQPTPAYRAFQKAARRLPAGGPMDPDLVGVSLSSWDSTIRKVSPWKAPGPDGLFAWWWKSSVVCQAALRRFILSGKLNKWWTTGRTILIPKTDSPAKPSDFRPIACLNTSYKIFTGLIAAELECVVKNNPLIPAPEQRALVRKERGCLQGHLIDQTLVSYAKQRKKPLSVGWVDFAKAFDSVSHKYLLDLLRTVGVREGLIDIIKRIMNQWRTVISGGEREERVRVRSGVFQGDTLSPLLFCLSVAPISHTLRNSGPDPGFVFEPKMGETERVSHIYYVDDLKVFADTEAEVSRMLARVRREAASFGLTLNPSKCAVHTVVESQKRDHPTCKVDSDIPRLGPGNCYKYLGIPQRGAPEWGEAYKDLLSRVRSKVSAFVQSELTLRQVIRGINATVMPAIEYVFTSIPLGTKGSASMADCTKLNAEIRRCLVDGKLRYAKSSVARLYVASRQGGIGLHDVEVIGRTAIATAFAYLHLTPALGSFALWDISLRARSKRSRIGDLERVLSDLGLEMKLDLASISLSETTSGHKLGAFQDATSFSRFIRARAIARSQELWLKEWQNQPVAGNFLAKTNIDLEESVKWLQKGSVSLINARNSLGVQEGNVFLNGSGVARRGCRGCGKAVMESPTHIAACCERWLSTLYVARHDSVCCSIHTLLCRKFSLKNENLSYRDVPGVIESAKVKILYNMLHKTADQRVRHRKPDLIIFFKQNAGGEARQPQRSLYKRIVVLEVAVSAVNGIDAQRELKRNRYCVNGTADGEYYITGTAPKGGPNLRYELETLYRCAVDFAAVVIGVAGEIPLGLKNELCNLLELTGNEWEWLVERMSRSAVLGTSRVVKAHAALDGRSMD